MNATVGCPECGAEVRFSTPGAVLCVCSHCQSVVAKRGLDVQKLGKVAPLADVPSPLHLGRRGAAHGGFRVVGRLQYDHGVGTWNEWHLALDNGRWLWLAEVQGRYYLSMPMGRVEKAPDFARVRPGHSIALPTEGGDKVLRVSEVHTAKLISAEGELPFLVIPNQPLRYVDLSGPKGSVGTLDYGPPGHSEVLGFLGQQVRIESLKLDPSSFAKPQAAPARAGTRMSCPQCQGALELRAPDSSLRVTCPYCRALVDVSKEPLSALATLKPPPAHLKPILALGAKGTLRGRLYTVLGHLRREIIKGDTGFWDEYLLWTAEPADSAFAYLIVADGHFTLTQPVNYGEVEEIRSRYGKEGRSLRKLPPCTTKVTYLQGEFPWAVSLDETVLVNDWATSESLLSVETTVGAHQEKTASLGHYLQGSEVWKGFALSGIPPFQTYVAPHQPNPYAAAWQRQKTLLFLFSMAMFALCGWSCGHSVQGQRNFTLQTVPGVEPAAEHIVISEPFELGQKGQQFSVEVALRAEVENSWVAADVSLISEDSGMTWSVPLEVSYYHGYQDGESWSEGSRSTYAVVPTVPAGRYVLRIEPSWPTGKSCTYGSDCGPTFSCQSGRCVKSCLDSGESATTSLFETAAARSARQRLGAISCGSGYVCQNTQCVLGAVNLQIKLAYPTTRLAYGFWLWVLMALIPAFTFLRSQRFEQRRIADNS